MVEAIQKGLVKGFLHRPQMEPTGSLVLTHGAGANCNAPLLVAIADAFSSSRILVLRCDLPFRQRRPTGPPHPPTAKQDQAGLAETLEEIRKLGPPPYSLGGHSYGGRQASMLAADKPGIADALLLFSYPLHPPDRPEQLRTAHFPSLTTPAFFISGARDPFGTVEELELAINLIPASTRLLTIPGAGHDLKGGRISLRELVVHPYLDFLSNLPA